MAFVQVGFRPKPSRGFPDTQREGADLVMTLRDPPWRLHELLSEFEMYGHPGPLEFRELHNILIDEAIFLTDPMKGFQGRLMVPEGVGLQSYIAGQFPSQKDQIMGDDMIFIGWELDLAPPTTQGKMLLWNVRETPMSHFMTWCFDEFSICIPMEECNNDRVKILELCSGGFGGWSMATTFLRERCGIPMQVVALDEEKQAVQDFAIGHSTTILEAHGTLPSDIFKSQQDYLLHGDVRSTGWWTAVATWKPDILTLSAPCPPWTGAASSLGLACEQGMILPTGLILIRIFRPKVVLIEQVQNFASHPHKKFVLGIIKMCGYDIHWARIVNAADFGASHRFRWLCLAVRQQASIDVKHPFQMWPSIRQITPDKIPAFFRGEIPGSEKLIPTHKMLVLAMDETLLPPNKKIKREKKTGEQMLNERCHLGNEVTPTIMAMYGQQHELDRGLLEKKGYLAHFLIDEKNEKRLMHPLEIGIIHLVYKQVYVDHDFVRTWRHLGNQITMTHALLLITNALKIICQLPEQWDIKSIFNEVLRTAMTMKDIHPIQGRYGTLFVDKKIPFDLNEVQGFLLAYDFLRDNMDEIRLPRKHGWNATQGIFSIDEHRDAFVSAASQITVDHDDPKKEDAEYISPTCAFQPLLKVRLDLPLMHLDFWVHPELSTEDIASVFSCQFIRQDRTSQELGISHSFEIGSEKRNESVFAYPTTLVITNQQLTIHKTPIQADIASMHLDDIPELYDQFGPLQGNEKILSRTLITDFQVKKGFLFQDPWFIVAAFEQVKGEHVVDHNEAFVAFRYVGAMVAIEVVCKFWATLLSEETFHNLALLIDQCIAEASGEIRFQSKAAWFPIPSQHLCKTLSVAAARLLLDAIAEEGVPIIIKWNSRILWKGSLHPQTNVQVIIKLLNVALLPFALGSETRLIFQANCICDALLKDLVKSSKVNIEGIQECKFHINFEMSGGGGTKDNHQVAVRNSIAATMLEQGFRIELVSRAIDQIIAKAGMKKATAIANMPPSKHRVESILTMCKDCAVELPQNVVEEAAKVSSQALATKLRKKQNFQLNPLHYVLEPGLLLSESGDHIGQIQSISAQQTGVMLMTPDQAAPWAREGQVISKDELGIAVIGSLNVETKLNTSQINIQCRNQTGQSVVLACTLLQLGEKKITIKDVLQQPNPSVSCQTAAITLWKEDWGLSEWNDAIEHTSRFVRGILAKHDNQDALISSWGRSFRDGKDVCVAPNAKSIQIHATFKSSEFLAVLQASGFNHLFLTPKTHEGRVDTAWRIIWVQGNRAHLTSLAAQHAKCAGLVKSKGQFGLRFHVDDFTESWKIIYPMQKEPSSILTKFLYRIEPLPFGTTGETVTQWTGSFGWQTKPVKALGPRGWLVGTADHAPPGLHVYNGSPVLLKWLPPKQSQGSSPLLAGPRPTKQSLQNKDSQVDPIQGQFDPWANWQGTKPAANPKAVTGPTEQRFKAQDEKIGQLENALQKLTSDTKQAFEEVKTREEKTCRQSGANCKL